MKWPGITVTYSKEVILIKITCLAWFIAKVISFKLWVADRSFPIVPTLDFLSLPNEAHLFLFVFSLIGIAGIFFFPYKRNLLLGFIFVEILSCFSDQMRWQPWEYQYLLTLMIFFLSGRNKNQFLQLFNFLIAVTYIFSGIHKFSGSFLYSFWDQIILHRFLHLPYQTISVPFVHYSGLILPVIEVFIGVGLLLFRNKWPFGFAAMILHLIIVLIFGPTGISYNIIILPWNFAMLFLSGILTYKYKHPNFSLDFFRSKLNLMFFVLVGMLPVLNFFDKWDAYLSFNLYSGNTKKLVICVDNIQDYPELGNYQANRKDHYFCNDNYLIDTDKWALNELKVPVYPNKRVYEKIKHSFDQKYPNLKNTFVYYWYPYKRENIEKIR